MKAKACMLWVFLFLTVVSLFGCDGGGSSSPTSPSFTPNPGVWTGTNIRFYVSSDGNKITTQGSTLRDSIGKSVSLSLWLVPYTGACSGTVIIQQTQDIPINNLSIEHKRNTSNSTLEVKGQFSSSTNASGTYSFSNTDVHCAGTVSGSGNWSASSGG